jgi:hypothetical protein
MVVGNRPPAEWADAEIERFEIGLTEVRALFFRAEDLALDEQAFPPGAPGIVELMRISLTTPGRKELRQMLHLRAADSRAVEQAEKEIKQVLEERFHGRRDAWAAVLGRMIQNFLDTGQEEASNSGSEPRKLRSP